MLELLDGGIGVNWRNVKVGDAKVQVQQRKLSADQYSLTHCFLISFFSFQVLSRRAKLITNRTKNIINQLKFYCAYQNMIAPIYLLQFKILREGYRKKKGKHFQIYCNSSLSPNHFWFWFCYFLLFFFFNLFQ